jgi:hypothetical protein
LGACGSSQSASDSICDQSQRTELLTMAFKGDVGNWSTTPPFTIKDGEVGWVQVTRDDGDTGLFAHFAGIAEVYYIPGGTAPNVGTTSDGWPDPRDPHVVIDKGLTWQKLPMKPGQWQLYNFTTTTIEVVSCPAG